MNSKTLFLCAAAAAGLFPVASFAQDAPSQPQKDAAAASDSSGEIVVTAQRRAERLVEVPLAISAASGADLKASGVTDLADLPSVTAGLTIPKVGGMAAPTVRGIGTRSVSPGDEQVVPVYIDGIYQSAAQGLSYDMGDVERVEVLKGPQSALYGRNATGGAINIITRRPGKGFSGNGQLEAGTLGDFGASGYLGGGGDVISGDVTFAWRQTGDYIHDIARGVDTGEARSRSVRAKLFITPSERDELMLAFSFSDGFDQSAISYRVLNKNTSIKVANPTVLLPDDRFHAALSQDNNNNRKFLTYNARYTHNFEGFNLVSISSLQDTSFISDFDGDNTAVDFQTLYIAVKGHNFYQEDYLTSTASGPLSWTVGGVYYRGTTRLDPQIVSINRGFGRLPATRIDARTDTKSFALYGELTFNLSDQLALIGGIRQTWETRSLDNVVTNYAPAGPVLTTPSAHASSDFKKTTPSATLQFKPNKNLNIYARYSQAFKAGLYNVASTSGTLVQPESVTQYEFGIKSSFGDVLYLNGSVYHTDYTNLQVTSLVNGIATLSNAAQARLDGAEAEIAVRPTAGLTLRGSVSYVDAKYKTFLGAVVYVPNATNSGNVATSKNVSGNPFVLVPDWSGSLGADYHTDVGGGELSMNLNAQFSAGYNRTLDGRIKQAPYTVVNGEIGYRLPGSTIRVAAFARNLLDKTYDNTVVTTPGGDSHSYATPRIVGVKLSAGF